MTIGVIDTDNAVQEGWLRDQDNEISIDGYNAFIAISTNDGSSGFDINNSNGTTVFSARSNGSVSITGQLQIPINAYDGYVLTTDALGNSAWKSINKLPLPTPTQIGQVLYSTTPNAFTPAIPLTSLTNGWLLNNSGILLVTG